MRTKTPMTGGDVRPAKPVLIRHTAVGPGKSEVFAGRSITRRLAVTKLSGGPATSYLKSRRRCRPRPRSGQNRVH